MRGVRTMSTALLALMAATMLAACSGGGAGAGTPPRPASASAPAHTTTTAATPTPAPTPPLPPYAIDALRTRPRVAGPMSLGPVVSTGPGFTRRTLTWVSGGRTMTGLAEVPAGSGPFPVVIVNHGYVPVAQYFRGEDSTRYGDALAAAGFLALGPDYPGYAGSGPGAPGVPDIVGAAIADMDLVSSLPGLPIADAGRVAVAGHSNGGGVALILLAADSRIRAAVLYAPVSSDMADNARRWWVHSLGGVWPLGSPDTDPDAYALMSPRYHLPHPAPPTLVMQGTADEQIPAAWTEATVRALQAAGVETSYVPFPGAMHIFSGTDLARANALAVDWLRRHLGGAG